GPLPKLRGAGGGQRRDPPSEPRAGNRAGGTRRRLGRPSPLRRLVLVDPGRAPVAAERIVAGRPRPRSLFRRVRPSPLPFGAGDRRGRRGGGLFGTIEWGSSRIAAKLNSRMKRFPTRAFETTFGDA